MCGCSSAAEVMEFRHRGMFCLLLALVGWTSASVYPSTDVCWEKRQKVSLLKETAKAQVTYNVRDQLISNENRVCTPGL